MQIEVERLDAAGEPFAHTYRKDELELDDEQARLIRETRVEGRATRKGLEVRLRGSLSAEVEIDCDRCADAVADPLEVEFDALFVPAESERSAHENVELATGDLDYSVYVDEAIDLDELAREQILLALPARRLCRETCKGLCPTCGANLNVEACDCAEQETDPRWAALGDLRKRQD